MRQIGMMRDQDAGEFVGIVELSMWDIFRLLLGREVEFGPIAHTTILRAMPAFSAFNRASRPQIRPIKWPV